jgi:hypothetical protein
MPWCSSRNALVSSVALVAVALVAQPAAAAFVEPPPFPRGITAFPMRDFVSAEGYLPNTAYSFRVIRNGVTIGSAAGTTDAAGFLEANHPGGVCWQGSTPNIIAQDKVVVTPVGDPADSGDAMTVQDVTAVQAVEEGANVVVRGTANNADGSPLNLGAAEQRIVNPAFRDLGLPRRDIRAVLFGIAPDGVLAADPGGAGAWTATYDALTPEQSAAAVAGETRVLAWQAVDAAANRLGITIYEVGAVGGPGFGGCPAAADYAVTGSDRPAVTKAMKDAGSALTISGVAQDASAVDVRLTDGSTTITAPATAPQPATGAQTWSATFSAAQLETLQDGTLTASGSFTVADPANPGATTAIGGASKLIVKDTVAPGDPSATPAPGAYETGQSVSITGPDPAAAVHFTVNGDDPTAASPRATGQISVTSTLTIRAVAVDGVGNPSAVQSFAYVIGPPAGGTTPANAGGGGGGGTIAGSALATLSVKQLRIAQRIKQTKAQKLGLRLSMRLSQGTEIVQIRVYRKTRSGLKLLSVGYKTPPARAAAGLYRVTQSYIGLRRLLRRGSYEIRVTPGYSKSQLGVTAKAAFRVV